jgi:hypothetical protein
MSILLIGVLIVVTFLILSIGAVAWNEYRNGKRDE